MPGRRREPAGPHEREQALAGLDRAGGQVGEDSALVAAPVAALLLGRHQTCGEGVPEHLLRVVEDIDEEVVVLGRGADRVREQVRRARIDLRDRAAAVEGRRDSLPVEVYPLLSRLLLEERGGALEREPVGRRSLAQGLGREPRALDGLARAALHRLEAAAR